MSARDKKRQGGIHDASIEEVVRGHGVGNSRGLTEGSDDLLDEGCENVSLHVIHGDEGDVPYDRKRTGEIDSNPERRGQSGADGDADQVDVGSLDRWHKRIEGFEKLGLVGEDAGEDGSEVRGEEVRRVDRRIFENTRLCEGLCEDGDEILCVLALGKGRKHATVRGVNVYLGMYRVAEDADGVRGLIYFNEAYRRLVA